MLLKTEKIDQLPLKKPRKKSEIWLWQVQVIQKNSKIGLILEGGYDASGIQTCVDVCIDALSQ